MNAMLQKRKYSRLLGRQYGKTLVFRLAARHAPPGKSDTLLRADGLFRHKKRPSVFLDPAILATKPMVTVNGLVEGEVERRLEPGSDNYAYPVVAIQDLTIWPHELIQPYAGSLAQSGGTTAFSQPDMETDFMSNFLGAILRSLGQILFSQNRRDYRSRYNNSYSSSHSTSSSSASPSPPPERDIPPQFRKGH